MQNKSLFELNGLHTNSSQAAAGPSWILKSWLGLREVVDWELKLDGEEELQVEEVNNYTLLGTFNSHLIFCFPCLISQCFFSTQIY